MNLVSVVSNHKQCLSPRFLLTKQPRGLSTCNNFLQLQGKIMENNDIENILRGVALGIVPPITTSKDK